MKVALRFWGVFDRVLGVMAACGMAVLAFILLAVVWEVITRYFLGKGTMWVEEIGEYSMLYMTFLGAAWLLKHDGHVEMDIVVVHFPARLRLLFRAVISWIGAVVCLVLMYAGAAVAFDRLARGLHQPTPVEPPDFPLFAVIPLGFLMLFIQFLRKGYASFVAWREGSAQGRVR